MTDIDLVPPERCEVAIVGGGPSGLAAATELTRLGVRDVWVLEREPVAGGIPRHCGHPPFGLREFHRCYTGPRYAEKLVKRATSAAVRIVTSATVVRILPGGALTVSTNSGMHQVEAKRVLLCTGVRETPRSARLVSGVRPAGILTTGALQSMVYLKQQVPCRRPIVVGTELVSFSALLTCRHAGITPVAMIEETDRITAWKMSSLLPHVLGIPLHRNTRVENIQGDTRVERVQVSRADGATQWIECDGIVFSGQFVPESGLCRTGHLQIDDLTAGPRVDQFGRCSDPAYFATGNLLRPVETAGWCWQEGINAAGSVFRDLNQVEQHNVCRLEISIDEDAIKYVMPQQLSLIELAGTGSAPTVLQVRLKHQARGKLQLHMGNKLLAEQTVNSLPERRILFKIDNLPIKSTEPVNTGLRLSLKTN